MNKNNWPNFFIVGAPRSGTTSLYNYLKTVPEVFMSPVKEPGYFIPNDFRGFTEESYLQLFKDVKDEKILETLENKDLDNLEDTINLDKETKEPTEWSEKPIGIENSFFISIIALRLDSSIFVG